MQHNNGPTPERHGGPGGTDFGADLLMPPGGWLRTFASLRISNYRWLWISMTASSISMNMQMIARGWLVAEMTDSPLALGLVSSAFGAPLLIFSLFGGVIADRVKKKNLLIISQSGSLLVALIITILIQIDVIAVWHLVVASLLVGVVFSFNMPAQQAIIPELVGEQSLMNAIALNSAVMNLCRIAAPSLAGFLVGVIGVAGVYWIVTVFNLVAIFSLFKIRVTTTMAVRPAAPIRQDLVEGLRYIRYNPVLVILLVMAVIPVLFAMPYQMLMPIFARNVLEVGASGYGLLMSMSGAGALVGSLGIASLGNFQRKGLLLLGFGIIFGISLTFFALSHSFPLSLFILFVVGIGSTGIMALNNTLIQINTPHEVRGRVMSLFMMTFGLMPLGTLPAGAIAEVVGVAPVVGVGGAIVFLAMLVIALTQPKVRSMS